MVQTLKRKSACIADLKQRTKWRIPRFAFEYVQGGCNQDLAVKRNRIALDKVCLRPDYLTPSHPPELTTTLFGQPFDLPFGIAPLGLTGLVWPQTSLMHARAAKANNIPFVLSTVSTVSIEDAAAAAEENFWFQLYPPTDQQICEDLLKRVEATGCKNLVVTVDVPTAGQRPKDTKNGLSVPPKITLRSVMQSAMRPEWGIRTLLEGLPQFASLQPYMKDLKNMEDHANFVRHHLREPVDDALIARLRERWKGQLIIKGINHADDAKRAFDLGVDGIIVSNHGGRQLDAARTSIEVLPSIVAAVGDKLTVMADSGVESGVDIARFYACGAQFVFTGRPFLYGVGAHAEPGAQHAVDLLKEELEQVMMQVHCQRPTQLTEHLIQSQESQALTEYK
ncbi:MAG: alpha-hydroxy acid oxidase [Thiolinea sp.]